jgi:hypothetical protein
MGGARPRDAVVEIKSWLIGFEETERCELTGATISSGAKMAALDRPRWNWQTRQSRSSGVLLEELFRPLSEKRFAEVALLRWDANP